MKEQEMLKTALEVNVEALIQTREMIRNSVVAWFRGMDADECMNTFADFLSNIDYVDDETLDLVEGCENPWSKKQLAVGVEEE